MSTHPRIEACLGGWLVKADAPGGPLRWGPYPRATAETVAAHLRQHPERIRARARADRAYAAGRPVEGQAP